MTELIAITGTGVALATLILTGQRGIHERLAVIERQQGELRERMAHLEGLLEGLREAITSRVA